MRFREWLEGQRTRQDAVGRLAAQLLADPICPFWSHRLSTYRCYLVFRSAGPDQIAAFEATFLEWRHCLRGPSNGPPP